MKSAKWPADDVERWPIAKLVPYARNSRKHSESQIDQIAASMREWGWTNPILVDDAGEIIAGHGRVEAARKLDITEVPVMVARGWSDEQKRAYVLADNKLAMNATWDEEMLGLELSELGDAGFDMSLIGFSEDELAGLAPTTEGLTDPDEVPEVPIDPVSVLGDVWVMGPHRLMCGDSTSVDAVDKLMAGQRADFCFTSPPYSQQRDYSAVIDDWDSLMGGVFGVVPVKDGAQVLVNLGLVHDKGEWSPYWDGWIDFMRDAGWKRFAMYVWDQGPGLPGDWNGRLAPSFELIFHFCKETKRAQKTKESKHAAKISNGGLRANDGTIGGRTKGPSAIQSHKIPDSVVRVIRHKGAICKGLSHPAVFPVALPIELMEPYTKRGDICYEPFNGSGTQIISAETTNRICYAMDIAPAYVDVAVKRWQNFTGESATLDGVTFDEIASQRKAA